MTREDPRDDRYAEDEERDQMEEGREGIEGGHDERGRMSSGTEAVPKEEQVHPPEHESGYGGKLAEHRVSSDERLGT